MNNYFRYFSLVAVAILFSACSSPPKIFNELQPEALGSDAKVGVIWLSRCSAVAGCKKSSGAATLGEFRPIGSVGLLTLGAILSAHQEIIDALDTIDAADVVESAYLETSQRALQEKGITAKVITEPYYPGTLEKSGRHKTIGVSTIVVTNKERESAARNPFVFEQTYDFTDIAETADVDFLLVLDVLEYGVHREFGPFAIPTTEPYTVGAVRLSFLDFRNNELLLNDYSYHENHVIEGEWKQPGSWTNLLEAVNGSLRSSIEDVMSRFAEAKDSQ